MKNIQRTPRGRQVVEVFQVGHRHPPQLTTAIVLVNHRSTVDAKTGKPGSAPLPAEELDKLTALVQEAVGYKKERGDSVRVVNIPFRADPKVEPEAVPVWQQPWFVDLLKVGALPGALTLVALMLLFGVVRPALRPDPPPPAPKPDTTPLSGLLQLTFNLQQTIRRTS